MSEYQKHFPWDEGSPTKPDVDALLKAYPPDTIKPGEWRVTDDEVRQRIGVSAGNRYRTVTLAWRRRLQRDYSVLLHRDKNVGFFCPTPEEVFANTHPTLEQAGRKIGKQLRHVAVVKPQNELQKTVQEHQGRLLHATKRELKKARMNSLPSSEATIQPAITPPSRLIKK